MELSKGAGYDRKVIPQRGNIAAGNKRVRKQTKGPRFTITKVDGRIAVKLSVGTATRIASAEAVVDELKDAPFTSAGDCADDSMAIVLCDHDLGGRERLRELGANLREAIA